MILGTKDMKNNLNRINSHECIVYLETYNKVADGIVDAYIDFRQRKDVILFGRAVNYENNKATFIELRSMKFTKRLRQGCYYKLNLDLLRKFQMERREDSLLIGASYNLSKMQTPDDDANEILQAHEVLEPDEMSEASVSQGMTFEVGQGEGLRLFVKDVNQANWNELRNGDNVKVVYDAGASIQAKEREVRAIIDSRKFDLMQSKPVLVLSHWDMDHIHCLKVMTDIEIKDCFSKLVCPDKLKSITSINILNSFKRALGSANVCCLSIPARTNGTAMHLWKQEGCISLYQAERSSQINYCGLVLFVRGANMSASYTGDCKLNQARNVYEQEKARGLTTDHHVLIAPHHGGDYGANCRRYAMPCNRIMISVGAHNIYGHPHPQMIKYLASMGNVERTDQNGDLETYL